MYMDDLTVERTHTAQRRYEGIFQFAKHLTICVTTMTTLNATHKPTSPCHPKSTMCMQRTLARIPSGTIFTFCVNRNEWHVVVTQTQSFRSLAGSLIRSLHGNNEMLSEDATQQILILMSVSSQSSAAMISCVYLLVNSVNVYWFVDFGLKDA